MFLCEQENNATKAAIREFEEKASPALTDAQKLLERSKTPKTRTTNANFRALMQAPERLLKRSQEEIPSVYTLRNHHSSDRVFNRTKPLPDIKPDEQFRPTHDRPTKPVIEPKPPKGSVKRRTSTSRVKVDMHTVVPRPPTTSSSLEDRSRPRKRNSAIITDKKSSTSRLHDVSPAQSGTHLRRSTSNTTSKRKPSVNEVNHKSTNSTVPAIKQKMQPTCMKVPSNFKVRKAASKDTQRAKPVKPVKPAVQKPVTRVSNNDKELPTSSHLVFEPKAPAPPSSNRKPSNSNINGFRKRRLAAKNSTSPRLS